MQTWLHTLPLRLASALLLSCAAVSEEPKPSIYVAGAACESDADCPTGECAHGAAQAASDVGYCTATCKKVSDCDSTATCVITDGKLEGTCLPICFDAATCREGFRCVGGGRLPTVTIPGACVPLMTTDSLSAGVAGRSCEADQECEGGHCAVRSSVGASYPGGYCSGRCYEDNACGAEGRCLLPGRSAEPGHCLRSCESDPDCARVGYRCIPLGDGQRLIKACMPGAEPLPDGVVGQPCAGDSECAKGTASCASAVALAAFGNADDVTAPGGYCTQACYFDNDCGTDGQCIASGLPGGICLARCNEERPCRDSYECVLHLRDGDPDAKVCIPRRNDADADADADAGR